MVSRPARDHFGLKNGLEIRSRHSVMLLIIMVLMIVMLLIIVAEESDLLEDAYLIFDHFGTLVLFRPVKSTVKLKSA